MALNLARVQGRWSMTLASGARDGSRGWRLVTVTPGRPGHQPAGTMTGARGASLEVPHRLAGNPPRELVCHEAWPRLSLGMKYSQWQRAVVGRREASAQRSARAAPRWVRRLDTRLSAFRFLVFSVLTFRGSKRRS